MKLNTVKTEAEQLTSPFTGTGDKGYAGTHTFINASEPSSLRNLFAFAQEYGMPGTSACILVPDWPRARFNHYLKDAQVLKSYPANQLHKYPVKLLYAPVKPAQPPACLTSLADGDVTQPLAMHFAGTLAGYSARISVDTQASHNFVSAEWVRRSQVHVTPVADRVTLGDGLSEVKVLGKCLLRMHIGALHDRIEALVLPSLGSYHDAILGDAYLKARRCMLDYGHPRMIVRKGERTITVSAAPTSDSLPKPTTDDEDAAPLLLTALQAKRALRKHGDRAFMVMVRAGQHGLPGADNAEVKVASAALNIGEGFGDKAAILKLLKQYSHLSPEELPSEPVTRPELGVQHTINLVPGATPPAPRMYRLSPREKAEVEVQIRKLLKQGFIQPSCSPYGAPVLFVPKPNGTLRMVIDYRALNRLTVKDKYPLPRIDDLIDQLKGAKVYSSLDLTQGYYQLKIAPSDVPKTAFKTHIGLYEYKVLPMGLSNAPATFQRAMNALFAPLIGKFVCIYLDDILVYSRNPEEHVSHLKAVFELMDKHQLYTNMAKCKFNTTEVKFLGHIIGHNTVKPDPAKVQAVVDWPVPTDIHQLRSFLGLVNYFSKFIDHHARVAQPLTTLLRKQAVIQIGPQQMQAFEKLKALLVSSPVLAIADVSKPFQVVVDASQSDLGGLLLQEGKPVAYESRKLNSAECRYPTHEREMLAAIHCLKVWRCYLEGAEFELHTDHKPLLLLTTQPHLSARQARWMEFLSRFTFAWHYKKGKDNPADHLTRRAVLAAVTRAQAAAAAAPAVGSVPEGEGAGTPVPYPEHSKALVTEIKHAVTQDPWFKQQTNLNSLDQHDGLWYLNDKLVIPADDAIKNKLLAEHHDAVYSGHPAVKKTTESLSRFYWWPDMKKDITRYVDLCDACQRNKSRTTKPAGLLRPLPIPEGKWESIGIDFIVRLPCTKAGNDAVMVVVDRFSKLVHLIPTVTSAAAEDVASLFIEHVVKLHGLPQVIVSDRDSKFTSVFWKTVCELWGIKQGMSSSFHPQTDGQTERVNRMLEEYLRHYVSPKQDDWDKFLPMAEFALNDSYQSSIQMTPFYMTYGCHPRLPGRVGVCSRDNPTGQGYVDNIEAAVKRAKRLLADAQQKMKLYADKKRRDLQFSLGDLVLLSTSNITLKTPGAQKLLPRFIGPYKVIEIINPVAYKLDLPREMSRTHPVFHVSLLRPYKSDGPVPTPPPPLSYDDDGVPVFEVEQILDHRDHKRGRTTRREYLIKWRGYGPADNTWEPESGLSCADLMADYWASRPKDKSTPP